MSHTEDPAPADGGVTRHEMHHRRIDMRGWGRSDGLYEVDGSVVDRKPRSFTSTAGTRPRQADEPIHDMGVRLVFDDEMTVLDVSTFTHSAPHDVCFAAGPALQSLKGLRMSKGWRAEVRKRLAGAQGCTHLMELLYPMATVAFQTLTAVRAGRPDPLDAAGRPVKIDSCYAYASDREVVMRRWPAFHTGPPTQAPDGGVRQGSQPSADAPGDAGRAPTAK